MRRSVGSSLAPERINRLPVIRDKDGKTTLPKYRPQENPACKLKFGGSVSVNGGSKRITTAPKKLRELVDIGDNRKQMVDVPVHSTEVDNPDIPDVVFDSEGNMEWDDRFKSFTNLDITRQLVQAENNPRKGYMEARVKWLRMLYNHSLMEAGLCPQCLKPLKVKQATLLEYGAERKTIYAVIKSHFELRLDKAKNKLCYRYVDGSRRNIQVRRGYGQDEYWVGDEKVAVTSEYQIVGSQCLCTNWGKFKG